MQGLSLLFMKSNHSGKAAGWTVLVSNLGKGERFFLFSKRPDCPCSQPTFLFSGHSCSLSGVKRPGREVRHSPTSTNEVKNQWSCSSSPHASRYGVEREKNLYIYFISTGLISDVWVRENQKTV